MITKAYVTGIPERGKNIYKVNIPLMSDNTGGDAVFNATLCTLDSFNSIKVGDCVFVEFEDDKLDTVVILGKLFVNIPDESQSYILTNELKVTGHASLPPTTRFGDYTAQDITNLYNATLGSGNGDIDESALKKFVEGVNTERDGQDIFANKIRVMTGEEYENYLKSDEYDEEECNNTLYFLSSPPPSEKGREDGKI